MSSAPRILHVLGSSKFGGATGVVLSLAEDALRRGASAQILSDDPRTLDVCRDRGVGVVHFRGIDRPIRPHKDVWAAFRLARTLRGRFDIVHTHTTKGGAIGRLAAHWAGVPIVLHTVHGFSFHEFSSRLTTWFGAAVERMLAKYSDKIIFVNTYDRLRALELRIGREDQNVTIYNGIPESRLEVGRGTDRRTLLRELALEESCFLCVFVGRLSQQKGLKHLLEAMAIVKNRLSHPPVHLAMIGEGELRSTCERQVHDLAIQDRVHLLGFRRDCLRWTGGCDAFVLSSLWEGHSITLLEAMGLGRPVVATDIKGNRESITHDHDGLLVRPADAGALAEGIMSLVASRETASQLGEAAHQTFQRRFTVEKMKDAVWRLYQELMRAKDLG